MTSYVVDSSVAAKWLFEEDYSAEAERLLTPQARLHAPDLMKLELDSVVCRRHRGGELQADEAIRIQAEIRRLPVVAYPYARFENLAFEAALRTRGSIYDCAFLALGMLLDYPLVTADRCFYKTVSALDPDQVVWIGDC